MNQTETLPEPTPRKLHVSTCIFFTLVVLFFVQLNLPGQIVTGPSILDNGKYGPHFGAYEYCVHGWPFTYLHREAIDLRPSVPWTMAWRLSIWRLTEGVERFTLTSLVANVTLGLTISFAISYLYELRRRRRRLLQFHLIDLFALVAIVAVGSALFAYNRAEYRKERLVLKTLEHIVRETEPDPLDEWTGERWPEMQYGGSTWLRELVGNRPLQPFDRVVGLGGHHISDNNFQYALKLRKLKTIWTMSLSTRHIKMLEQFPDLEALDMMMAWPTDEIPEVVGPDGFIIEQEAWITLPKLPKLRGLNLYEAAFRGDGLENIPSIEHLVLFGTALTDDAAKKLTQLQHLKILSLGETNITTKSLPYLAPLTQMQELGLTLKITDDGLHHLSQMHDLRSLTFDGSEITDASIPIFKRFTKLEYLDMGPTKMTKKGLDELHSAFPKCEFY